MSATVSTTTAALRIEQVSYRYRDRWALVDVSLEVPPRVVYALVGPNGSGKSTLFRLVATLLPLQQGKIVCFGWDVQRQATPVRWLLGVVFQSPSLDRKLTVWENLLQHAALYGMPATTARQRGNRLLDQFGVADRRHSVVETLSGGMRRRVELAKAMMSEPRLLVMDEPSTGLDPKARIEFWGCLEQLRKEQGTTIVLTTHLLDEAERADRVAILDGGRLITAGTPHELRAQLGGDVLTIQTAEPQQLRDALQRQWGFSAQIVGRAVRLQMAEAHRWIPQIVESLGDQVSSVSLGKPTLEDVFIARTGHRFDEPLAT